MFLSRAFRVRFKKIMFWHQSMENYSFKQRAVFFWPFFHQSLPKKRAEVFDFLQNRFDIPHCTLRFSTLTLIFCERFFGKVVIDRTEFLVAEFLC